MVRPPAAAAAGKPFPVIGLNLCCGQKWRRLRFASIRDSICFHSSLINLIARALPLQVQIATIDVLFSETYDSAPPLPRPLRSKHDLQYITAQGLLAESLSVAPLTKLEESRVDDMGLGNVRSFDDDPKVVKYTKSKR